MAQGGVFDPGLQPERTALAWRRTLLALVVVAVVGERLLSPVLGRSAFVLAGVGFVSAMALLVLSTRRARGVAISLGERGDLSAAAGGGLLAGMAAASGAVGLLVLVLLLVRALPA